MGPFSLLKKLSGMASMRDQFDTAVIASEARQSSALAKQAFWIAASLRSSQ